MRNLFCLISLSIVICLLSLPLVRSDLDIEKITFRLATLSFNGVLSNPLLLTTCEMGLPMHFDTILTLDPADKLLHFDYPDGLAYTNDFQKFVQQSEDFAKCQFGSLIKYSQKGSRLHLNLNPFWNDGFFVDNVNLLTKDNGDWTVQLRIEEYRLRKQTLVVYFDFEKMRSKEEIDVLVEFLKTLNGNIHPRI
jgi:hypothetical protein